MDKERRVVDLKEYKSLKKQRGGRKSRELGLPPKYAQLKESTHMQEDSKANNDLFLLKGRDKRPLPASSAAIDVQEVSIYTAENKAFDREDGNEDTAAAEDNQKRRSGEVVAGLMSLLLGMAALTTVHWWSAADPAQANLLLLRFSSWLPGGLRIGAYGGKEMVALGVWISSWLLLFLLLKRLECRLYPWIYGFTIGVIILLVLLWPPVYHRIYGWPV